MQTSEALPQPSFAPLPLRPRGALELIDITIKLFRRYFWVLAAWSGLVVGSTSTPAAVGVWFSILGVAGEDLSWERIAVSAALVIVAMFVAVGLWPFVLGAATCCIAAAVRGQNVTFRQCWNFTRPRYGSILLWFIVACLVAFMALGGYIFLCTMIFLGGMFAAQSLPDGVGLVLAIAGGVFAYGFGIMLMIVLGMWAIMTPMVSCLDQGSHIYAPMRRVWDLMRGHWRRASGVMLVLGLSLIALSFINSAIAGVFASLTGGKGNFNPIETGGPLQIGVSMALNTLSSMVTTPFMFLLIAMFYLDLRVRKEALDLEWSAHVAGDGTSAAKTTENPRPMITPQPSPPASDYTGNLNTNFGLGARQTIPDFSPPSFTAPDTPTATTQKLPSDDSNTVSEGVTFAGVKSEAVNDSGVASETTVACPQCSSRVAEGQQFCMQCGARVAATRADNSDSSFA